MLGKLIGGARRISSSSALRVGRTLLLGAALLAGSYFLVEGVNPFYAVQDWLIWRYCAYWIGAALYTLTCQVVGTPIVARLGRDFRWSERLLLAQTLGMLVFSSCVFVLGIFGLLLPAVFWLLPALLLACGAKSSYRLARRLWRLRGVVYARPRPPASALTLAAWGLGIFSLIVVYSQIIHPLNTSFDARWYHLSLAEQYAGRGAIMRFPNASFVNAYPQLVTLLYSWAFLAPGAQLFDRVGLCSHLVYVMFLWILVGVALLTRRLMRRAPRASWCGLFLFPGLFLYDSGLHLGADQASALFAAPVALTCLVTLRRWNVRNWLLTAAAISGAALTKYSAIIMFMPPVAALMARGLVGYVRQWREPRRWFLPPLVAGLFALALTAQHWAKNWVFYANPIVPYAADLFKQPWSAHNRDFYTSWLALDEWTPKGTFSEKLDETLHAVPLFAFKPHDWWGFHHDVPVFGFLFTLSGLALPFVRGRTRRVWALLLATYAGIWFWYWGFHQDRYLQVLLPWMAPVTVATLVLAWRTSHWVKLPVAALVALQLAWGSDVPFIPGHAMLGKPPTVAAIELASSGYRKQSDSRLNVFEPWQSMSKTLNPRTSVVLAHEQQTTLGLGAMVIQDHPHMQGLLEYGAHPSLTALYRTLRSMGVTHVSWSPRRSTGWYGFANDFVFFDFLREHVGPDQNFGGLRLAPLMDGPDVPVGEAKALLMLCSRFERGLYSLPSLRFPDIMVTDIQRFPKPERVLTSNDERLELLAAARYLAFDASCNPEPLPELAELFSHDADRASIQLWIRKGRGLTE